MTAFLRFIMVLLGLITMIGLMEKIPVGLLGCGWICVMMGMLFAPMVVMTAIHQEWSGVLALQLLLTSVVLLGDVFWLWVCAPLDLMSQVEQWFHPSWMWFEYLPNQLVICVHPQQRL